RFRPEADNNAVARKHRLTKPYVLTVATNDRRKNLPILAETAQRLHGLGLELVWAGDTRSYLGQPPSVQGLRHLGYIEDEDLPGLYRGARAFVLPSRYEGFGLTCIEAMACGTPVVAADRAALPETCAEAALLVDPDDRGAVAEAVIRAATESGLRDQLRQSGLRRAAEISWERTAAETDALLMSLAPR